MTLKSQKGHGRSSKNHRDMEKLVQKTHNSRNRVVIDPVSSGFLPTGMLVSRILELVGLENRSEDLAARKMDS